MSALAAPRAAGTTTPARLRPVAAVVAPHGPRLLLPPITSPPPDPLVEAALVAVARRPVSSPVTEQAWPVQRPDPEPGLPDPARLAGSIALAALEALAGTRPITQLTRWVTPGVLDAVASRAVPRRTAGPRATVRRTHLTRVSETAAEASVVLHDGARVRAAALRLEVHRGRWRVTVLQIG